MKLLRRLLSLLFLLAFLALPTFAASNQPSRQKVIDFEGDLVEGVNKRPFDSLSEVSEKARQGGKSHLYKKRKGFRTETGETLREMGYL